jgi:AraC-like DNA-binding protein
LVLGLSSPGRSIDLRRVPSKRKYVGLIFPAGLAYSHGMTEGILRQQALNKNWTIIEFAHIKPGQNPLPDGGVQLDAAVTWAEPRDRWVADLVARGCLVVNCGLEWIGADGVASVHFDHAGLHRLVLDHLKSLGMPRAVIMGHRLALRPASARSCEDFARRARAEGMTAEVWSLEGDGSPALSPGRLLQPENEHQLAGLLKSLALPCALCCASDHMAFIAAEVAARLGLRVPADLAIIGVGDNALAATANPPLTSVAGDAVAVGEAAGRLLAEWLTGGRMPANPVAIPGARLIARESTTGKSHKRAIEIVRQMIQRQGARGVSVGELVAASGLSPKTLVRHYQANFGVDPVEEIQRLRIAQAKRLLAAESRKIVEVAAECGFSSQAAFNNYFRRHTGCSPGDFVKAAGRATPGPNPG